MRVGFLLVGLLAITVSSEEVTKTQMNFLSAVKPEMVMYPTLGAGVGTTCTNSGDCDTDYCCLVFTYTPAAGGD